MLQKGRRNSDVWLSTSAFRNSAASMAATAFSQIGFPFCKKVFLMLRDDRGNTRLRFRHGVGLLLFERYLWIRFRFR